MTDYPVENHFPSSFKSHDFFFFLINSRVILIIPAFV